MKHILVAATLTFASLLATLGQVPSGRAAQDSGAGKRQGLPSPMMGFKDQPAAPLQVIYDSTLAVPDEPRMVEVKLVPEAEGRRGIRAYTFYCEEELANASEDGGVVRQFRRFRARGLQPVIFRVQSDSQLTFWLGAVEYRDGSVWRAELP